MDMEPEEEIQEIPWRPPSSGQNSLARGIVDCLLKSLVDRMMASLLPFFLSDLTSQIVDLDEIGNRLAKWSRERIDMNDALRIESSDREVNVFFERLKIFKSDIVHQVARKLRRSDPIFLDNVANQSGRLLTFTEPKEVLIEEISSIVAVKVGNLLKENFKPRFSSQHWNEIEQAKRMLSSGERRKPESKGMVFKRKTLRKQHNSQRDDPGELFPDLVELQTILEDCVFHLPQLVSFIIIIIYGLLDLEDLTVNDTNMDEKMLMISNQGCGEEHELSVVVGNTPIIVV